MKRRAFENDRYLAVGCDPIDRTVQSDDDVAPVGMERHCPKSRPRLLRDHRDLSERRDFQKRAGMFGFRLVDAPVLICELGLNVLKSATA